MCYGNAKAMRTKVPLYSLLCVILCVLQTLNRHLKHWLTALPAEKLTQQRSRSPGQCSGHSIKGDADRRSSFQLDQSVLFIAICQLGGVHVAWNECLTSDACCGHHQVLSCGKVMQGCADRPWGFCAHQCVCLISIASYKH